MKQTQYRSAVEVAMMGESVAFHTRSPKKSQSQKIVEGTLVSFGLGSHVSIAKTEKGFHYGIWRHVTTGGPNKEADFIDLLRLL